MSKKEAVAVALLFITAFIWGAGFIASRLALDAGVTPELLMLVRFSIASILVATIFNKNIRKNLKRADIIPGVVLGVMLYLGFYIQNIALQYTTPANNAFLTSANVIMVPFISWAITRKLPGWRKILACVIFIVGIFILSVDIQSGFTISAGDSLTLVCAFFFACHISYNGRLAERIDTATLVFLQLVTSAVLSAVMFFILDGDITPATSLDGLLPLLFLALFSTFACYLLQTFCQTRVGASQAAIILGTESLFGALFSVILGYDPLSVSIVVGGGIMLSAVVLAEWQPGSKITQKE